MDFIICDDEKIFTSHYKEIINNFMMRYDVEYKIYVFDGYDENFKKLATEQTRHKVYILDIKTKAGSGIQAARMIREEIEDWNSMIIIVTSFCEYKYELIGRRLMILDFINKLENPDKSLREDLKICMKNFDNKPITLKFKFKGINYNIDLKDIIFIEKEQDSKRCIVHTEVKDYYINGSLSNLEFQLDNRFFKTHRSLIVNKNHIVHYNSKKNEMLLKDGEKINLISRNFKKEVSKNVRVIS